MSIPCQVSGCTNYRSGYSLLCHTHRSRKRRHGHEQQRTISKVDLKPFIQKVQDRIAKQPAAKLWSACDQRWEILIAEMRLALPPVCHRARRIGREEFIRLANMASGRDVAITIIAVYLLQAHDPRLFRSETGFRTQLVRRVRSLAGGNYSEWGGAADGRKRRTMKELEPCVVEYMSAYLVQLFGPAGLKVAQIERLEEEEHRKAISDFHAALSDLK